MRIKIKNISGVKRKEKDKMKKPIIHKKGQQTERYIGFGQYDLIPSPLCVGAKMLYKGYSYYVTHLWRDVTCKHCLKKRK